MKRSRYSPEQIAFALRQAENGTPVVEVCRKMGISEQTFYRMAASLASQPAAKRAFGVYSRPLTFV